MDWFTWLSKTGLEPSLVYEYGMAFAHNELEHDDIAYFNHEFLQSMGISIAKHRLEILKLAKKERRANSDDHQTLRRPVAARLLLAIKRTKRCLAKCLRTLVRSAETDERSALMVVQRPQGYGSRLRGAMLKRNNKLVVAKQARLMITNGSFSSRRVNSFSSPVVFNLKNVEDHDHDDHSHSHDHDHDQLHDDHDQDGYWSTAVEEIRWDTLFQDLKPT